MCGCRAPGRGNTAACCTGVGAGAIRREQRDWRRPAVACRSDPSQWLSHHRGDHVRRAPAVTDPCHAGSDPARSGHRRTRRLVGTRSAGRDRGRVRGDDANWARRGLSGVPRQGLARPGSARSVRRRRRGWPPSPLRHRDHGQGFRARREPVRRDLCSVGDTDGEVSPVPRRPLGLDGGAAGRAEVSRHARVFDRTGWGAFQRLYRWRAPRGRHRRSRKTLGARADRVAPVAVRLVDSGHEYRDVRSHRATPDRPRQGEKSARRIEPAGIRSARQAPAVQGQVRRVDFRPLHCGHHPPRPGAHARAVRACPLRRCENAARRGRAHRDTSRSGADRGAGGG